MEKRNLLALGVMLLLLIGCAGRGGEGLFPGGEPGAPQNASAGEGGCDEECIQGLLVEPKTVEYAYIVHGEEGEIEFEAYGGLNDYLAALERDARCDPICPEEKEIQVEFIENEVQRGQLLLFLEEIKAESAEGEERARIAVSIVQQMPYDWASVIPGPLTNRYPYEVLYDYTGVCGEKSRLLAFLLKELGYGVALFEFNNPHHIALGVECPGQHDYLDSGYCIVETTVPSIITYSNWRFINQEGAPIVHGISAGRELGGVGEEYADARELDGLVENYKMRGDLDYAQAQRFGEIMEKYGMELE